jgi:FAD/FMN-containing dehydrogenase
VRVLDGDREPIADTKFGGFFEQLTLRTGRLRAEHGMGRVRLAELERYKSAVELEMMRKLKATFDRHNLLNPGKIIAADE